MRDKRMEFARCARPTRNGKAPSLAAHSRRLGACGDHVASATYAVHPAAQGKGIGRALVEHSLAQAQSDGFMAMQFNYVVSSNAPAVELYKKLGFIIVGTLPKAFRNRQLGPVDAYVMYRFLQPQGT